MAEKTTYQTNCSCVGCLLSIVAMIAILWILFHISDIVTFITN